MTVIEGGGSVSRRELRHMLMRRRNERIVADRDATGMPRRLLMHPDTLNALLVDGDAAEQFTMDFEGKEFCGVPVMTNPEVVPWTVEVDW